MCLYLILLFSFLIFASRFVSSCPVTDDVTTQVNLHMWLTRPAPARAPLDLVDLVDFLHHKQ